ncbi:hypothetical protein HAX54_014301 [Datura stramonium]|uniref:Wax synthase domain-containing protein n=1 Tax=Datura stramonium TaxID=4076 RepID=A0ABS8Y5Z1_DATST|nr:hypothetical protein [Datura stramonium]
MFSTMIRVISQVELESPFDEPYKTSSLQDFWSRRWNLMVTNILRPSVYVPVRSMMVDKISRKWAPILAVLATFFISGLMHELIFYYVGRLKPSGEVTCFFLIHGVALTLEIVIKKLLNGKVLVPKTISGPLALGFIISTSFWLFFPPLLRAKADVKVCTEFIAFSEFVKYGKQAKGMNNESDRGGVDDKGPLSKAKRRSLKVLLSLPFIPFTGMMYKFFALVLSAAVDGGCHRQTQGHPEFVPSGTSATSIRHCC